MLKIFFVLSVVLLERDYVNCEKFARVLSRRTLPGGIIEIKVPFEDTYIRNGVRYAHVRTYPCIRTVAYGKLIRKVAAQCRPRVVIAKKGSTQSGGSGAGDSSGSGNSGTKNVATAAPKGTPLDTEIITRPPIDELDKIEPSVPNDEIETPPATSSPIETVPPVPHEEEPAPNIPSEEETPPPAPEPAETDPPAEDNTEDAPPPADDETEDPPAEEEPASETDQEGTDEGDGETNGEE